MIFDINYIIYIIYSFLVLFLLYICLQIYKKYSFFIYKQEKKILSSEKYYEKKNKTTLTTLNKIRKLKKKFKIKSSEKSIEDINFISNKPNYININNSNKNKTILNLIFNNDTINNFKKIKNYNNDDKIQEITKIFLSTKQEFFNIYVNSETNEYFIKNLSDFYSFYKTNINDTKIFKNNILLKFYNDNGDKYIYIYVSKNKMTKIIYDDDYNNISDMIEKNNGIFILTNNDNEYYVGYGSFTQSEINLNDIKDIFFSNTENYKIDKNYKLFNEFKYIKIYFYVCNKIN